MSGDERLKQGRGVFLSRGEVDAPEAGADHVDNPPLHFEDPRTIRALAHPARMAIINALASGDELTATDCAAMTGLSPSATAYHLKLLQRFGFAEPAPPRPDGRERPWRTTGRRPRVNLDASTPAGAAASSAVIAALIDDSRTIAVEFTESSDTEPADWRDAGILAVADLWLTVDEIEGIGEQLAAVLKPYRERVLEGQRPEGSRRVRAMNIVIPHKRPPTDSGE
jgi:DNA-binding transcriptional ArsR family regulator